MTYLSSSVSTCTQHIHRRSPLDIDGVPVDFVSVIDAHTGFLLSWRFDTETSRLWRLDYDNHSAHIGATMRGLLAKRVMPPSRSLTACTTTKSSLANEDIDG